MPQGLRRRPRRPGWPLPLGLAAAPLVLFCLLALLPILFGRSPAVGVSAVEHGLCALDPEGVAEIIVGGDSRALYHVVPAEIEAATGRTCINVARWTHLGGDATTLVNALRRRPEAMARKPIIILSVTVDGLNDLGFKGLPMVAVLNWSLPDHARVLAERPKAYPAFLFREMLPSLGILARDRALGRGFSCGPDVHRPARLLAHKGADFYEGRKTSGFWSMPAAREDYLLDGGQRRNLRAALAWLDTAPVERVILLNAPVDTAWLRASDGPVPVAMQAEFSDLLAEEAARHRKAMVWDYVRQPLPLADSLFHDQTHLNREGALLFSRHLGGRLAAALVGSAPAGISP